MNLQFRMRTLVKKVKRSGRYQIVERLGDGGMGVELPAPLCGRRYLLDEAGWHVELSSSS